MNGGVTSDSDRSERRRLDPQATRTAILKAARLEFAEKGLSGARIDTIGAQTRTAKRMIYYYFGSKEGLYLAVLEQMYAQIREAEERLDLAHLAPEAALDALIRFTFDYQQLNADFVRVVANENTNHAKYLKQLGHMPALNAVAISSIADILRRGYRNGVFRRRVEPIDIHWLISSLCYFRVSNQYTFSALFGVELTEDPLMGRHRAMVGEVVLGYLSGEPALQQPATRGPSKRKI